MIEKIIQDELDKFYPEMIKLRRYMHMHPEVSFNEKIQRDSLKNI